ADTLVLCSSNWCMGEVVNWQGEVDIRQCGGPWAGQLGFLTAGYVVRYVRDGVAHTAGEGSNIPQAQAITSHLFQWVGNQFLRGQHEQTHFCIQSRLRLRLRVPDAMKKSTAAMLSFVVAPLIASAIGSALTPIHRTFDLIAFLALIPFLYVPSCIATIFFGVTVFLLLLRLGLVNLFTSLCGGAFVGMMVAAIIHLPRLPRLPRLPSAGNILVLVSIGAVSALGFWLVWRAADDP